MPISNTPVAPNLAHSPPLAGYNVLSGASDRPQSIAPVRRAGIAMLDATGVLVDGAGRTVSIPYILAQSGLPVIIISSGTFADTVGAMTGLTALPYTPSGVVQVFVFSGDGIAASELYWATFSSATACQLFETVASLPAVPGTTKPSGITAGAYAGGTAEATLVNVTLPGGALGLNGSLRILPQWSHPNNANSKSVRTFLASTSIVNISNTTNISEARPTVIRNRNSQLSQLHSTFIGFAVSSSGNFTPIAVDTSIDQLLSFRGLLAVATDFIILNGFSIEVLPG